jgi:DNA-binding transcriptional regulator of glucitol operon
VGDPCRPQPAPGCDHGRVSATPRPTQELLRQRYGRRGPARWTLVLVAVVSAAFLGWLVWATWSHATPTVESDLVGFSVVDDHAATAVVEVVLHVEVDPDQAGVRCLVRATSEDHTPVGELSWVPTAGRNEVDLRTERLATAVELVGCTATDQQRPR